MKRYAVAYQAKQNSQVKVFWTRAEDKEIAIANFFAFVADMQDKGRFGARIFRTYPMHQL